MMRYWKNQADVDGWSWSQFTNTHSWCVMKTQHSLFSSICIGIYSAPLLLNKVIKFHLPVFLALDTQFNPAAKMKTCIESKRLNTESTVIKIQGGNKHVEYSDLSPCNGERKINRDE